MLVKRVVDWLCIVVSLYAVIAIIAWEQEVKLIASIWPYLGTMKLQMAMMLALSGILLYIIRGNGVGPKSQYLGGACSMGILGIASVRLWGYYVGVVTVEDVAINESVEILSRPGRPSIGGMVAMCCTGLSGVFWMFGWRQAIRYMMALVALIGSFALLGYAFNVTWLYYHIDGISSPMAFTTTLSLIIIGLAGFTSPIPTKVSNNDDSLATTP